MSLRDYFAAQVATGECAGNTASRPDPKSLAAFAYEIADAMLAERAKGGDA